MKKKYCVPILVSVLMFNVALPTQAFTWPFFPSNNQITVTQLPSTNNDTISFEVKNISSGTVSLNNWSLENTSGLSVQGVPFLALIPNGTAIIEVNKTAKQLDKTLKLIKLNGKTIDKLLHITPKNGAGWLGIVDVASSILDLLTSSLDTFFPATTKVASPRPTPQPSPIPIEIPANFPPSPTPIAAVSPSQTPSSQPSPEPSSDPSLSLQTVDLHLTELLVCHETYGHQWLKIYNADPQAINMDQWRLRNQNDRSRYVSAQLPGRQTTTVTLTTSFFSKDGNTITLEKPDGTKVFIASFGPCQTGRSFTFGNNANTPDPAPNETSTANNSQLISLQPDPSPATEYSTPFAAAPSEAPLIKKTSNYPFIPPQIHPKRQSIEAASDAELPVEDQTEFQAATSSNTILGTQITTPENASSSAIPISSPQPIWIIVLLIAGGSISACLGGIGFYQWYKEYQAKKTDLDG